MRHVVLPAILFALGAPPLAAQVYKWVDANGVTHYSSDAPASQKSRELRLRESTPRQGAEAASSYSSSLKDREIEFRKRQALREREETRLAEEKAQRDHDCRSARIEMSDLRNTRRLYEVNEKGERVYMSDAQRDAEVARREAEYNRRCG
jgi:hypothetical protein